MSRHLTALKAAVYAYRDDRDAHRAAAADLEAALEAKYRSRLRIAEALDYAEALAYAEARLAALLDQGRP